MQTFAADAPRKANVRRLGTGYAVTSKWTDTDWFRKLTVGIVVLLLRGLPVFDNNKFHTGVFMMTFHIRTFSIRMPAITD